MKPWRLSADPSATRFRRIRPIPGPFSSTATTINAFFSAPRPRTPSSSPPTNVSSTSTRPARRSQPGRTIARRSLCSQVPCCLVAPEAQHLLQRQGARTRLLAGDDPHGAKLHGQRGPGILKDGAGRHRGLSATGGTLEQQAPHWPRFRAPTVRTAEAVWPSQLNEVGAARLLRAEPGLEFGLCPRIIAHRPGHYILGSPESSG